MPQAPTPLNHALVCPHSRLSGRAIMGQVLKNSCATGQKTEPMAASGAVWDQNSKFQSKMEI